MNDRCPFRGNPDRKQNSAYGLLWPFSHFLRCTAAGFDGVAAKPALQRKSCWRKSVGPERSGAGQDLNNVDGYED